jgi:hypothetical protein
MDKVEVLIKECEIVGKRLSDLVLMSEKIVALGFTIIAVGMSLGIKEKIYEILLVMPVAAFGVLSYGILVGSEIMSLGGYKRYLEEKINITFRENILLWESFIAKQRHRSFEVNFLNIIYALFLLFVIGISLSTTLQYYTKSTFVFMLAVILTLTFGLIIALYKMKKNEKKI